LKLCATRKITLREEKVTLPF